MRFLEKYGVEHYSQTEEYNKKLTDTNLDRYGVDYYSQTEEWKEKVKRTSLERYGVEHFTNSEEVKETARKTNREKYGSDYYTQTDEYKISRKETAKKLASRTVVIKMRELKTKLKISLTCGWYQKDTETLEEILKGLEVIENMLEAGISKKEIAEIDFSFHFRFR